MHTGCQLTEPTSAGCLFEKRCSNCNGAWSCLGANGLPRSVAVGNIMMLLTKRPTAQGGKPVVFHNFALPKGDAHFSLTCESVARANIARAEPLLKPVHALL